MSQPHSSQSTRRNTHLSLWTVLAGSRIVQIVTTRVREFYERRYKAKRKEPMSRLVFIFDAVLMLVIALLIGLILNATLRSFAPSLFASFESSGFGVAVPTPVIVVIKAPKNGGIHRNVRAFWKLPSGVEILESNPKLLEDGSAYLGALSPDEEVRLHLVVRTYRPFGETVTIGLQLQEGGFFDARSTYASFDRRVDQLGLSAEIPKEVLADHVVPKGAVLPIRVSNQTNEMIEQVEIRPTDDSPLLFDRQSLGDLPPHSSRFVYLPLEDLQDSPTIGWSLVASSYIVASSTWHADVMEWANVPSVHVETDIDPSQERNPRARVTVQDLGNAAVVVMNPTVSSTISEWRQDGEFYFYIRSATSSEYASVIPVGTLDQNGSRILGPANLVLLPGSLSLRSSVRYFSAAGDQIGAGPNPPQTDIETRYWVFFTVDQSEGARKNIHVRAMLSKGVEFTGSVSVPDGGSWSTTNRVLDWKLPIAPSEQSSVMIGAEISITPTGQMSSPYPILSAVRAEAEDVLTGISIDAKQGILTTDDVDRADK